MSVSVLFHPREVEPNSSVFYAVIFTWVGSVILTFYETAQRLKKKFKNLKQDIVGARNKNQTKKRKQDFESSEVVRANCMAKAKGSLWKLPGITGQC